MTPDMHLASLEHAAELIDQADALINAAGAGMGVDSDMPDFRGQKGFWAAYPPSPPQASTSPLFPIQKAL